MPELSTVSNSCRIPTALCFDVEDLIAPEADDAVLWMAEILREYGLTGSFMLVGENVRLWERRERQDVIEALKCHHLAFHSTWHSTHPTTTELCLPTDFAQGMDTVWNWDQQGWQDTERILGRPLLGWARTGNSWSPSVVGLMGRMGRAYAYSQVRLPGHNICWYGGCLNFYFDGGFGGFDTAFYDDAIFDARLERVQRQLREYIGSERKGAEWLNFFICHPTRAISTEFWDAVNFARGANPPRHEWKPAAQHDPALIPTMQANLRRLCAYLRNNEELEIIGWGDMIARYDGQRSGASHTELEAIARQIAGEQQVLFTDFFTAGEILLMLCQSVVEPREHYVRPNIYGPLTMPPVSTPEQTDAQAIKQAAKTVLEAARSRYLPASVEVGGQTVGLGTFFVALAEALAGHSRISLTAITPYPVAADAIAAEVARVIPEWPIHPDNMDLTNLLEQTRLQCWTLKPAWPRDIPMGK